MKWPLLVFLATWGVVVVGACVAWTFLRHRYHRAQRVDPKIASGAPVTWLADPRQAARLHRRLTKVGRATYAIEEDHKPARKVLRRTPEAPPIVAVAGDLRREAVRLDHELTRAALLSPAARRAALQRLAAAVAESEQASVRLISLSAQIRTPAMLGTDIGGLDDVAAQVERLADAHRQLDALDARAGLTSEATTLGSIQRWVPEGSAPEQRTATG